MSNMKAAQAQQQEYEREEIFFYSPQTTYLYHITHTINH